MLQVFIVALYIRNVIALTSCKDDYAYDVGSNIGHGGQAFIVEALDRQHGTVVAIKVFHDEIGFKVELDFVEQLVATQQSIDADQTRCFPKIFGTCIEMETNSNAIVMERLDKDFFDIVLHMNPTFSDSVLYTKELLECVAEMHNLGFVHRDLKLENLMLTYDKKLKIVDYGTALPIGQVDTSDIIVGGVMNTAPESVIPDDDENKVQGENIKVDAWAAGLIVFTLFSKIYVIQYASSICVECLRKQEEQQDEQIYFFVSYFVYKCIFDTGSKISASEENILNHYREKFASCCLFRLPHHISQDSYRHCDRNHWLVQEHVTNLKWINDLWETSGVSADDRTFLLDLLNNLLKFNHLRRKTVGDTLLNPLFKNINTAECST